MKTVEIMYREKLEQRRRRSEQEEDSLRIAEAVAEVDAKLRRERLAENIVLAGLLAVAVLFVGAGFWWGLR